MTDLLANWPAPSNVSALTTSKLGGFSLPPYESNNFGLHVGDNPEHVEQNRAQLVTRLHLPAQPMWLNQTHTNHCVLVEEDPNRNADAALTRSAMHPLVIMTADCLPILLCNRAGDEIAAIHAGWKGLLNGIVENTVNSMRSTPDSIMAWIGPAICQTCYQTGPEIRQAYLERYPFTGSAFKAFHSVLHTDLPKLAELILENTGIRAIYQSGACSYESNNPFYSYRRQPQTGRMASLIWFNQGENL